MRTVGPEIPSPRELYALVMLSGIAGSRAKGLLESPAYPVRHEVVPKPQIVWEAFAYLVVAELHGLVVRERNRVKIARLLGTDAMSFVRRTLPRSDSDRGWPLRKCGRSLTLPAIVRRSGLVQSARAARVPARWGGGASPVAVLVRPRTDGAVGRQHPDRTDRSAFRAGDRCARRFLVDAPRSDETDLPVLVDGWVQPKYSDSQLR